MLDYIKANLNDLCVVLGVVLTLTGAWISARAYRVFNMDDALDKWLALGGFSGLDRGRMKELPEVQELLQDARTARMGLVLAALGVLLQGLPSAINLVR